MLIIENLLKKYGDKMPKTERIFTKNINVRISKDQYKLWEQYAKDNGFDNISKLVRHATDGIIDGTFHKSETNNRNASLRGRIDLIEKNNKELLKSQNEILKIIAKKSDVLPKELPMRDYQKQLIINLLQESPRDEEELENILGLSEIEILSIINDLLEMSIIEQYKDKYKVI